MEISNLSKDNRLSIWVDNLDDIDYMLKNKGPPLLPLFQNCFVETQFSKSIQHLRLTKKQTSRILAWGDNTSVISEQKVNKLLGLPQLEEENGLQLDEDRVAMNVKIQMVDVLWTSEEATDGRIRTFGDLMGIFYY